MEGRSRSKDDARIGLFGRREVAVEVFGGCSRLPVGRSRSIIDGGRRQIALTSSRRQLVMWGI